MRILYILILAAIAAPLALASGDFRQGGGLTTVYDPSGNAITVANRYDGERYFVDVVSANRDGSNNWTQTHSDASLERVNTFATDINGNVYVAGVRLINGEKHLWIMKYSVDGVLQWEQADDYRGCTAFTIAVTDTHGAWVGGSCANSDGHPVRVAHYSGAGDYVWGQQYDGGGRNYLRSLSVDFGGRVSAAVEVARGNLGDGNSFASTVVYDRNGVQVTVY